jgi:hypothetical protein
MLNNNKPDGPVNPAVHNLPESIGYALPLITLTIVLLGFVYYIHLIQKGKLTLRETFVWILFTLFMVFVAFYLLVLQIMSTFGESGFNLFNYLASLGGLVDKNGKTPEWLVLIIMIFLAYLYAKAFQATIKLAKLKGNINILSKEVAILNGKLNDTLGKREESNQKLSSPKKKVDKTDDK